MLSRYKWFGLMRAWLKMGFDVSMSMVDWAWGYYDSIIFLVKLPCVDILIHFKARTKCTMWAGLL